MTVSTGDAGLLQLPLEDYTVIAASLSDHVVSFSDPPIVLVTLHPTLLSANCVLDESHTMAVLNLEGSGLDGETNIRIVKSKRNAGIDCERKEIEL
ncbi:hypothetical protein BLNAU_24327 [Blattamonas nauphoetae]|uniref:Uncharacterized protein n=1 Tax=Blattamonas nauphoetae TaxID=2049346 RepID=A0ABQ9WRV1_9EUKA|nr:hypothetical protein BLNAU_24327 [Blattamonas nauphoetae]